VIFIDKSNTNTDLSLTVGPEFWELATAINISKNPTVLSPEKIVSPSKLPIRLAKVCLIKLFMGYHLSLISY
jgi:hypothetical protein